MLFRSTPRLPPDWSGCSIQYRYGETQFHIEVSRAAAGEVASLSLDGMARSDGLIPLADDGHTHRVALRLDA